MSTKFLGATLRRFRSGIGWNVGAPSDLIVDLVEDPVDGDVFTPPPVGTPVFFQFYSFTFAGILQKTLAKKGTDGFPVYEVTIIDPREILDGTQIILSNYNGSTGTVRNLLNVYGFWESFAFGTAELNEGGMPYHKVRDGILNIVNTPNYGAFGGPLTYRDFAYSLNLNEMPIVPTNYRVGGLSISLMDFISQICEDSGFDFFVTMDGYSIKIRTAPRKNQPPLGTITSLVSGAYNGTVIHAEAGLEERNEVTSSFLVGGDVTQLQATDSLAQFWGFDILGNPIISADGIAKLYGRSPAAGQPRPLLLEVSTQFMTLNAAPIADIIGNIGYPCSTLELRFAQAGMKSWSSFMTSVKPDVAQLVGLLNPIAAQNVPNLGVPGFLVNDDPNNVRKMCLLKDTYDKQIRVYEFVKGYADEFMGKKFLVSLPLILSHLEEESLRTITSYDITDAAYLEGGGAAVGLSALNADVFTVPDGRFKAFVRFDNLIDLDYSKVSPKGTALEGDFTSIISGHPSFNTHLFMECSVDSRIIYTPSPAAIVTLNGPIQQIQEDILGNLEIVGAVLQLQPNEAQAVLQQGKGAHGIIGIKVAPLTRNPNVAFIPLKSNILTYGPWYISGAPGKVKFEQDSSLVPWNYGGMTGLNLAGTSKVVNAITNMQVSETGTIELAAPPAASLGDVLQKNGPNITNISVTVGTEGVTTAYRFQTYAPRFGVFTKGYTERLRRLALADNNVKKAVKDNARQAILAETAIGNAARTAKNFMESAHKAMNKDSPHNMLMSHAAIDTSIYPSGMVNVGVTACEMDEAMSLTNADSAEYTSTAGMSMNGLLRPFTTSYTRTSTISSYTSPSGAFTLSSPTLDPWKGQNDIDFYIYGDTYSGMNALMRGGNLTKARPLALRGPLVMCGWGYDTYGNPVPSEFDRAGGSKTVPANNQLINSNLWKTGPIDHLWDNRRGVWTSHDIYKGTTITSLPAGNSGLVQMIGGDGVADIWNTPVWNWFNSDVPAGKKIMAGYVASDNRLYVIAADC